MKAAIVAALWLHYGAAILLFGGALFRRLVPPEPPDPAEDARLRRGLLACALLAVVTAIALLLMAFSLVTLSITYSLNRRVWAVSPMQRQ